MVRRLEIMIVSRAVAEAASASSADAIVLLYISASCVILGVVLMLDAVGV